MGKVVGAVALSLAVAATGQVWSQEIGIVSAAPNVETGELIADIPPRPDGDKVFIVRNGSLVTEATVKSSGGQGGAVISLPSGKSGVVQIGDRISVSPSLAKQLPVSAYDVKIKGDTTLPHAGQMELAAANGGAKDLAASAMVKASVDVGAPEPAPVQLEKGPRSYTHDVRAIVAKPTPRGMGVPLFPAPSVAADGGVNAPYGQGLAAAAPVGTPYLRSPAFAGPPIIYMPQTVTRVLLPGTTPYPSNIMSPPSQYVYASAPFVRTDIYTSLPYGTFYWPQGYAGTTPVEPQVPAYVTAPASAVMGTQPDYTAGRYDPAVANAETLNPVQAGVNSNLVSATIGDHGLASAVPGEVPALTVDSATVVTGNAMVEVPAPADVAPFPVLTDASSPAPVPTPAPVVESTPTVGVPVPALPTLPTADPAGAPAGLPNLPAPSAINAGGLPDLPAAVPTPATMVPSLPTPAVPPAPASVIIVDDKAPGALTLEPAEAWTPLASATGDSHEGGALLAKVAAGQSAKATFNATIPADGQYEVALWWVMAPAQFRSTSVPVSVNTATGAQQTTIDQTKPGQWVVLGTYQLKAGQNVPVVTISTDGITPQGDTVSVSVDALRLTPQ